MIGDQKSTSTDSFQSLQKKMNGYGIKLDPLLTVKDAADYLNISYKTVYGLLYRRELDAERVGKRLRRIRLSTIEEWLLRNKFKK